MECKTDLKYLKTSKIPRAIEALLELIIQLAGISIVYLSFKYLLWLTDASDNSQDILISMLLLPSLYILKDVYKIAEPFTVKIEMHHNRVASHRGFATRTEDVLEFIHSENQEKTTTPFGRLFGYATIRLYSPGGYIELPYVCHPKDVEDHITFAKEQNKKA
ncbi:PH domain-containing protein [Rhodanobacter aciditrophus]|uniref:PH domain-containing protein n=1 Tax=Rhodanobacter aciditrophus TaxID=1623218 RepID=A0ABW4B0S1_9GAMM